MPYVDLAVIKNNPKVFLGYSDSTVTHFMCMKAGLSSFYGPAVMTAFAENVKMHDYTIEGIRKALFSSDTMGAIPHNTEGWTTASLDWSYENNQANRRILHPPTGWNFIGDNKSIVKGRLLGGCLELLQFLNGTELWPDLSEWNQAILFLETSEEGIEPLAVTRFMRNMAAQGILSCINGILFSKPGGKNMTAERFPEYDEALLKIFEEYKLPLIPIVTMMDFGHSDPMWTLPYGALAEINPEKRTVTILENGVMDGNNQTISDWGKEKHSQNIPELIPNTPYKIYKNLKNTFEIIDAKLYSYNKKCVPATQEPEAIDMHYVIKENDIIIAGICADVYTWKIMNILLLFVEESHRNKGLATILLQRVEEEAKAMGVTLVHTDSYDFQAKDFYIKHGYEVFGVLDDCPHGHKRYYLKKTLRGDKSAN